MSGLKILKIYRNKRVLVTGSNGFKGTWLCYWLYKLKAKVIGIGLKSEPNDFMFRKLKMNKKISQIYLDIRNFKELDTVVKKNKPDVIFHLAAQSIVSEGYLDPDNTFTTNVLGSFHVLETFKKNNIKNLVYITSDKCYLNKEKKTGYKENDELGGKDPYSSSKAGAEIVFKTFHKIFIEKKSKLKIATLRAGNVIGGGDFKKNRLIPDIIKSIKFKNKIFLRNPNSTRPWQHVLEPTYGYLLIGYYLIKNKLSNKIVPHWNFGPTIKNCVSVRKICNKFLSTWNKEKKKIVIKKEKKFKEGNILFLNITKAKKELNWRPKLNLQDSIKMTVDLYKAILKNKKIDKIINDQIKYYEIKL